MNADGYGTTTTKRVFCFRYEFVARSINRLVRRRHFSTLPLVTHRFEAVGGAMANTYCFECEHSFLDQRMGHAVTNEGSFGEISVSMPFIGPVDRLTLHRVRGEVQMIRKFRFHTNRESHRTPSNEQFMKCATQKVNSTHLIGGGRDGRMNGENERMARLNC